MNISPVSFRSTVGANTKQDFSTLLSRPQAYTMKEQPSAATEINGATKKKSPVKTILGILVAGVAIAAGLALGAKKGLFNPGESNKYIEMGKKYLKIAGDKVGEWAGKAATWGKGLIDKFKNKIPFLNKDGMSDFSGCEVPADIADMVAGMAAAGK